jgi:hypoxanthine phosphoribosyltransferase
MKTIQVKDKEFKIYIPEESIKKRIAETAAAMRCDLADKNPLFIVVLNGAFIFAADLLREIDIPCEIIFIRLSSYEGTTSTGKMKNIMGLDKNIEGRTVVIVEDIIDTGLTMKYLCDTLAKSNPAEIRVASLFVKPGQLQTDVKTDYRCFDIDNVFIVGYGLDYDGDGRNLKEIYKVVD